MSKQEKGFSRRQVLEMTVGLSGLAMTGAVGSMFAQEAKRTPTRILTIDAKPEPIAIDAAKTAVIVVDMQNDFGAEGGMFQRAGIDISMIQAAVAPTAKVLAAARKEGIKVIYLKMAFKPDLSDAGPSDSARFARRLKIFKFGTRIKSPNGADSRIFIRDTWNTDILPELTPKAEDIVLYKHRFSGFYQTELDSILKRLGIKHLIFTGCTTSVCVESTIRDAMFRDYEPVLLADCTGEPIGYGLPRSNHEASLLTIQVSFGWVSNSNDFIKGLEARPIAATNKS
ncbi:MAG: cysteine hydrolase family protein [Pyrinomonadaceae bacterium]